VPIKFAPNQNAVSEFLVSARKYRPSAFEGVVGQKHITGTLKNAMKTGKVAHAFLFCGPRGVGKTTSARILAKMLNCMNPGPDLEPCNACESCKSFEASHSFNIHELDAASNNGVDDIRILVEQVRIPPQIGKYSVYIIDEVHMLSQAAFNAFLKTLEEPPAHAIFILATTEKHKILPTILSRCQVYDFNRISVEDITAHLEKIASSENVKYEKDALHIIAQKADGALRDALSIFDRLVTFTGANLTYAEVINNLNILDYDYYFKVTDMALEGDYQGLLNVFNEILDKGFDGSHFNAGLAEHFRNLLVSRDAKTVRLLEVGENTKARYYEQAQKSEPAWLIEALKIGMKTDAEYKVTSNRRLLIELMLLQIATLKKKLSKPEQPGETESPAVIPSVPKPVTPVKLTGTANIMPMSASTISINPEKVLKKAEVKTGVESSVNQFPVQEDQPFTEEDLRNALSDYIESLKAAGKQSLYVTWTNFPYRIKGSLIEIKITNKIQGSELEKEKPDMLEQIRKKLRNKNISLNVILELPPEKKGPVCLTNHERFELMAQSNPVLHEMRRLFELDTETPI
jgi:DNA polymerase-3 subunit gamma/tau